MTLEEFEKDPRFSYYDGHKTFPILSPDGSRLCEVCLEILDVEKREDGEVISAMMVFRRIEGSANDIHQVNVMEEVGKHLYVRHDIFIRDGITAGVTSLAE